MADRDAFLMASPADRVAQLRIVELNAPGAFKAVLAEALATYYEARRWSPRSAGARRRRSRTGTMSHPTTMRPGAAWRR
ncbi:MAG: hypothetical protein HC861_06605 [Rhodospirillaceae bacterium]|nr:hypothetical protein [Rhodospirillaceae bacterium]